MYSREEDDSPCGASSSSFLLALVLLRLLFLVSMAALAFLHFLILVKTQKDDDDDDDDDVRNVVRIIIGTFSVLLLREVLFFFPSNNKRERKRDHRSALSLDLSIERLVGLLSSVVFFFCFRPFFVFFVFFFFERERDGKLFEKFKKLSPNEREKRRLFTLYTNPKLLLYIFFCGRKRTFSLLIKTIEELSLPKKECRIILRYFSIFFRGREKGRERER